MSVPVEMGQAKGPFIISREAEKEWLSEWFMTPHSNQDVARIVVKRDCVCFVVEDVLNAYERQHSNEFGWYENETRKITLPAFNSASRKNLELLLQGIQKYFIAVHGCKSAQIAYMLATVRVEAYDWTKGVFFGPIAEKISYEQAEIDYGVGPNARRPDRAKRHQHTDLGDGYEYRGRGLVQITWKDNYAKFSDAVGSDLVANPDLALEWDAALKIMINGMVDGLFTGQKLSDHISEASADYNHARRIINGTDKAAIIAEYAERFEDILVSTGCKHGR